MHRDQPYENVSYYSFSYSLVQGIDSQFRINNNLMIHCGGDLKFIKTGSHSINYRKSLNLQSEDEHHISITAVTGLEAYVNRVLTMRLGISSNIFHYQAPVSFSFLNDISVSSGIALNFTPKFRLEINAGFIASNADFGENQLKETSGYPDFTDYISDKDLTKQYSISLSVGLLFHHPDFTQEF
jgi:hypothetical protein